MSIILSPASRIAGRRSTRTLGQAAEVVRISGKDVVRIYGTGTFRKLREVALERLCEQILAEVGRITSDTKRTAHARYLAAYELIQERDDQIARAFNNPRRSAAVLQLATMKSLGLVADDEMNPFTPGTKSVVEALGESMGNARGRKGA